MCVFHVLCVEKRLCTTCAAAAVPVSVSVPVPVPQPVLDLRVALRRVWRAAVSQWPAHRVGKQASSRSLRAASCTTASGGVAPGVSNLLSFRASGGVKVRPLALGTEPLSWSCTSKHG